MFEWAKKKDRVEPNDPGRKHFETLGAMNNAIWGWNHFAYGNWHMYNFAALVKK